MYIIEDCIDPSRPIQIGQSYTKHIYQAGISVVKDALNEF